MCRRRKLRAGINDLRDVIKNEIINIMKKIIFVILNQGEYLSAKNFLWNH